MPTPARPSPFEDRYLDLRDLRIHYVEIPTDAPAMLLLHGIGMDWRVWQAISRRLAPHFHLYMLDLRGHGWSDKPAHGYSLPEYAADVEDVIDELGLSGVALIGSSLGGMVAASVEAPPDVVAHRILVDPPMTGGPVRDARMFHEILHLKHQSVEALAAYLRGMNPKGSDYLMRMMSEMWRQAADGVIEDMLARQEDYFHIDSALRAIDAPTLLVQADPELGASLSSEEARRALTLLPHGQLITVKGAGHAVHAFQPAEFTRILLNFVQRNAPATGGARHPA